MFRIPAEKRRRNLPTFPGLGVQSTLLLIRAAEYLYLPNGRRVFSVTSEDARASIRVMWAVMEDSVGLFPRRKKRNSGEFDS
jgi:hypothetical protein